MNVSQNQTAEQLQWPTVNYMLMVKALLNLYSLCFLDYE